MHRFYLADFQKPVLSAADAHHARNVLRLAPGTTVNLFDGRGREAQAQLGEAGHLTLLQQSQTPPLRRRITLAQAVPKKNMDLIVQKATELGVATIIPLLSERTIVHLDDDAKKLDRWRDIALESCKQCGNNWLPTIEPPRKAQQFFANPGIYDLKLIASLQPGAQPLKQILAADAPKNLDTVLILIGPEGDFTPAEIASAKNAGCLPLTLGPLVLRAETAALYTLSILHHELQVG
jgi:16S rRNA (uracil1498-N3)-methyltransferase